MQRFYVTTVSNYFATQERAEEVASRGASRFYVVRGDADGWKFYMLTRKPLHRDQRAFVMTEAEFKANMARVA
ncbi:hypothetical protein EVC29_033 [Rhizobium phage RHph_Y52]|nr:hypothetical protein EVB53_030 [Rhizobium phage RHph_Y60]QIG75262.1 hypothetical protein EVC16_033 [Rhizobium phage RHph_Y21]QIG76734.1 hypothetical protein EVC29_033 [Rhizobium phage RHph_Y52]